MKHDDFFRTHPIFTGEELARYIAHQGRESARSREALLAWQRKAGRVVQIRRGLYAAIPSGSDPESHPIDPFLIAAKLTSDAVLSHHTALEFHGRAYSVQNLFTYSTSRPLPALTFRSHVFRGTTFPRLLRSSHNELFAVSVAERSGMDLRVTALERCLVDILDRPDIAGSWEEIWRSLESVEFFDLDRVIEYAKLLGNATTVAKVGFYLEQHRNTLMVEEHHLEALHNLRPKQPHYLERSKRRPGQLVREWNLVVPQEVLDRRWGEVL